MNLPQISNLRQKAAVSLDRLVSQRFFRDKLSMSILAIAVLLSGLTIMELVFRLRPTEYPVPVHYSNISGFDVLGPWYQHYRLGIFSLTVTLVNGVLALKSFARSRITAFYLLIGALVVALFSLIITHAFLAFTVQT